MKARIRRKNITFFDVIGKPSVYAAVILLVSITALPKGGLAMKAGVGKRDVTVPELLGNPIVHDPLFARVLVLDDGDSAVAIIGKFLEDMTDTCLGSDHCIFWDTKSLGQSIGRFEANTVNIERQAVRIFSNLRNRIIAIGLVDTNSSGCPHTVGMQEDHD